MSYPSNLTREESEMWTEAMNYPLYKKGDVVDGFVLLEDSIAHGCPLVRNPANGQEFYRTMHGMREAIKLMKSEKEKKI